ncbi:hypothetical protein J3R82DRAFT_10708 [Butyriboletus roseoflavus]|nr:hypothetical protein J3R82DRAFT_10708 [Butyriboletus roseoflavus]
MLYLVVGAIAAYVLYQCFFADDRDDTRSQSRESPQPQARRRDERQYQQSIDSPHPGDYTPVEAYSSLRARAKQEGDLMAQCYKQSKEAYQRRDRARAKALSEEGKRHALKMENLNAQASATIFQGKLVPIISWASRLKIALREQPGRGVQQMAYLGCIVFQNKAAGEIDLHGLYVKEAISYSEKAIRKARLRGDSEIHLIVGMSTSSARFETSSSSLVSCCVFGRSRHSFRWRCLSAQTRNTRGPAEVSVPDRQFATIKSVSQAWGPRRGTFNEPRCAGSSGDIGVCRLV